MMLRRSLGGHLRPPTIAELVDRFAALPRHPFRVRDVWTNVQGSRRGVYAVWQETLEYPICLYVGSTDDMRSRLFDHLNGSHNDSLAGYVNAYGDTLACSAMPYDAVLTLHTLEQALIDHLQPVCNASPAC